MIEMLKVNVAVNKHDTRFSLGPGNKYNSVFFPDGRNTPKTDLKSPKLLVGSYGPVKQLINILPGFIKFESEAIDIPD